jgi:hypothetical protein
MVSQITTFSLKALAKHLKYEWEMFCNTATLLERFASSQPQMERNTPGLWSAIVESFALHTRILTEFLFKDEDKRHGNPRAFHFVKEWNQYRTSHQKKDQFLKGWWTNASQQVSHLTYDRARIPIADFDWHYIRIREELALEMNEFRKMLRSKGHPDLQGVLDDFYIRVPAAAPTTRHDTARTQPDPTDRIEVNTTARTTGPTNENIGRW